MLRISRTLLSVFMVSGSKLCLINHLLVDSFKKKIDPFFNIFKISLALFTLMDMVSISLSLSRRTTISPIALLARPS